MLAPLFHRWERRLASVATDRLVRPFQWGHDWVPSNGHGRADAPRQQVEHYVARMLSDTDAFYTPEPTTDYQLRPAHGAEPARLTFPSALLTPHPENNVVHARYFQARASRDGGRSKRAVLVLAQWNSYAAGHIGLANVLARFGMSALRLSLPYHDWRMPPELTRAEREWARMTG